MSIFSKEQAEKVAARLQDKFKGVAATFEAKGQLDGGGKVLVYHSSRLDEATLKSIEATANAAAGRTLVRGEIEYTTGNKHNTGYRY